MATSPVNPAIESARVLGEICIVIKSSSPGGATDGKSIGSSGTRATKADWEAGTYNRGHSHHIEYTSYAMPGNFLLTDGVAEAV
jgi:hypothetical protein